MQSQNLANLEDALQILAAELNESSPGIKRRQIKAFSERFEPSRLESWLDHQVKKDTEYWLTDRKHVGVATTLFYEHTDTFKQDYLDHLPWVGYGAHVTNKDLYRRTIKAGRAFHSAVFDDEAAALTTWKGRGQTAQARFRDKSLQGAAIRATKGFKHATFKPRAATNTKWFGEKNAYNADLPDGFFNTITDHGDNNFRYTMHVR